MKPAKDSSAPVHRRGFRAQAWLIALAAMLALSMAGVPRTLHQWLVPHRWCPLHQQIEHAHDTHAGCTDTGTHCQERDSASEAPQDSPRNPPDACQVPIMPALSLGATHSGTVKSASTVADTTLSAVVLPVFFHEVLTSAPKRSPPS